MKPFYAVLANGSTSLLASPTGSVEWLPVPRFDSPSMFSRMLDEHGGFLSWQPESWLSVEQRYHPEGLGLETLFRTEQGEAKILLWMSVGPTELWMTAQSDVPLVLTCRPMFGYGASRPAYTTQPHGARYTNPHGHEIAQLHFPGSARPTSSSNQWITSPGESTVVLRVSTSIASDVEWLSRPVPAHPFNQWTATAKYWQSAHQPYAGSHPELFQRSLEVIRALTFRTTGAPVVASTTSLPEQIGGTRQWDYRYVWIRDSAYAGEALLLAGDRVAAQRLTEFLLSTVSPTDQVFPAPFLRVDGLLTDEERDLLWLAGHENSRPVRMGNGASTQLQLDLAGSTLWLVYQLQRDHLDAGWLGTYWWAVEALADWMLKTWSRRDSSLWEYRSIRRRHTHSRVMNWVGLSGASILADMIGHPQQAKHWRSAADRVRHTILSSASVHQEFLPRRYDGGEDAALLTLPLYGFVDVADPWFQNTLRSVEQSLAEDGLIYRYRADDLGQARYPFILAGFWYARVLLRQGRIEEAEHVIHRHVELATPLGLFGEHVNPVTGDVLGNFPQLFSHVGLVATLSESARLQQGQPLLSWVPAPLS